ncbi:anti-sigma factor domain-containing protein [Flavobacterium sp. GT3R68]|uniref:anti-sigma factor n=1 Tax=Flavobacterium sp. GT3R68 TaxID=2594437 RepID=UPI000F886156|nr:anti-sigma factor [Flavobacterium sp. GT3R68]RTY95021.1 anti-sigma factor [Flavobacterium sp. GSN2]TRW91827.1 anti-sigma factor [Flavobacterium sp. GT3R68]
METKAYIESGILELYVYGLLSDHENEEVSLMAKNNTEVNDEIIAIEKAIVHLSTSFSPFLSADNFERIKSRLEIKHGKVIKMKPRSNWTQYVGWAAAVVLLAGVGYQYYEMEQTNTEIVTIQNEKFKLNEAVVTLEQKNKQSESTLAVIRDGKNTVVNLGGQTVAPEAFAKIYWNKDTQSVYVDAAGLPEPPEGMVYQVWALKLNPLTPTSIGLLDNFKGGNQKIFEVSATADAEAFGITLEPAGGSISPTMEQLYTLGKV